MSTAVITPLRSGGAVLELYGVAVDFPSWESAAAHARRLGLLPLLERFPNPPVQVLAVSPACKP